MDHKEKHKKAVFGEELESNKEKMKRSLLGSSNAEVETEFNEVAVVANCSSSPTMRECDICGRIFNGGKALGGHRRSHLQKNQKKVLKVRFTSKNNSANCADLNDNDDNGKKMHVCCVCKKVFPTKNALFGHMRSHPERSWRGVSPPPPHLSHKPSSSSSFSHNSSSLNSNSMDIIRDGEDSEDDGCVGDGENNLVLAIAPSGERHHQTDLSKLSFSPRWVKKDKRGRKCTGAYEAAETLAYISAYCKYYYGEKIKVSPKKYGDKEVLPISDSPQIKHGKRKIGESSRENNNHEVGKRLKFCFKGSLSKCGVDGEKLNRCNKGTLSESGVEYMNMDDDVEGNVDVGEVSHNVMNGEKQVKKVDLKGKGVKKLVLKSKGKDAEYESGNQEKVGGYKCAACGKIFSTFQGLGGHRSIHKEKNIVIMDESNHSDDAVAEENISSTSSNMDKVDETLLNEETGVAGYQSPDAKELGFDLNEVPSNVMEE